MFKNLDTRAKNKDLPERIIVLMLFVMLFTGSVILYIRDSRPLGAITVRSGDIEETRTLAEVSDMLKESRRVPINSAASEEITAIPGIGKVISERIVEYRKKNGPFNTIEALLKVKGIGPAKLEKIKEYVILDR